MDCVLGPTEPESKNNAQVRTAIEVRNAYIHRNGYADDDFKSRTKLCLSESSWAEKIRLEETLGRQQKIPIGEDDFDRTYDAMGAVIEHAKMFYMSEGLGKIT